MNDTKNLILALSISVLIIIGWQEFYQKPRVVAYKNYLASQKEKQQIEQEQKDNNNSTEQEISDITTSTQPETKLVSRKIPIISDKLIGSIDLTGAKISEMSLQKYTFEKYNSEKIQLLFPPKSNTPYFIGSGYLGSNNLPNMDSIWQSDDTELTPDSSITLTYNSGDGIIITRTISLDENYLFTIEDEVTNNSTNNVEIKSYSYINRVYDPSKNKYVIVHEGPIALIDNELAEYGYDDLEEEQEIKATTANGWLGFSDKYWLTAIIPTQGNSYDTSFKYYVQNNQKRYQANYLSASEAIQSGITKSFTTKLFIGAKELTVLDKYSKEENLALFDRTVDFGVFYFLTNPLFKLLNYIFSIIGNFGFAIIILTIMLRIALYPLANQSFKSMAKMKKLQPKINDLKKQHTNNKTELHKEIMGLYKKHNVNPASGCLPLLIQIPIFFSLYKVLLISIEMRHAEFIGWIHDLSAPDPTSIINLFGLLPYETSIPFGIWPCLMCLTMVLQQKLNPPVADPVQAKIVKAMPYLFTFLFISFPAGLVVYWTCNNILSILQQWLITRGVEKQKD